MSDAHGEFRDRIAAALDLGLQRHYADSLVCPDLELEHRYEDADRVRHRARWIVERKAAANRRFGASRYFLLPAHTWAKHFRERHETPSGRLILITPGAAEWLYRTILADAFGIHIEWSSPLWSLQ